LGYFQLHRNHSAGTLL